MVTVQTAGERQITVDGEFSSNIAGHVVVEPQWRQMSEQDGRKGCRAGGKWEVRRGRRVSAFRGLSLRCSVGCFGWLDKMRGATQGSPALIRSSLLQSNHFHSYQPPRLFIMRSLMRSIQRQGSPRLCRNKSAGRTDC